MSEIKFSNYGQKREINATDGELQIIDVLKDKTRLSGLRMVRMSDSYVTAKLGEWDFARFKYTDRAKWIMFPCVEKGSTKHRIQSPSDAAGFVEQMDASLALIQKYN